MTLVPQGRRNKDAPGHRKIEFEEEYILSLKKNGMEYDPRYVFG